MKMYIDNNVLSRPRQGIAEHGTFGLRKVFVIHDSLDDRDLDRIAYTVGGRDYVLPVEGTRHQVLSATVGWSSLQGYTLGNLSSHTETLRHWVEFRPHTTIVTLGQRDIVQNYQVREGDTFVMAALRALREFVNQGRRETSSAEELAEYDYRVNNNHCFVLSTPRNLVDAVEGIMPWKYDNIQEAVTEEMVNRRGDFYRENVFIMTAGQDLVLSIRRAIMKTLCNMCRLHYREYNLSVKYWDIGGCDDPSGASSLRDRLEGGERAE